MTLLAWKPFIIYTLLMIVFVMCGNYTSKKHPDIWKTFFPILGYCIATFCFFAGFLITKSGLPFIDSFSHAFLPILAGIVIVTLLSKKKEL